VFIEIECVCAFTRLIYECLHLIREKTTPTGAYCLCDMYSKFRKFAGTLFLFMRIYSVIVMLIRQDRKTTVFSNLRWTNLLELISQWFISKIYLQHIISDFAVP